MYQEPRRKKTWLEKYVETKILIWKNRFISLYNYLEIKAFNTYAHCYNFYYNMQDEYYRKALYLHLYVIMCMILQGLKPIFWIIIVIYFFQTGEYFAIIQLSALAIIRIICNKGIETFVYERAKVMLLWNDEDNWRSKRFWYYIFTEFSVLYLFVMRHLAWSLMIVNIYVDYYNIFVLILIILLYIESLFVSNVSAMDLRVAFFVNVVMLSLIIL